jgi:hypothetical protein
MDTQDQNPAPKSLYPPAYAHIEKKVRDTLEKIKQFDEQIKNIPNDRGPDLSYNPPAFIKSRQFGSRDQLISSLEKAKSQLKTDTWKAIEQELNGKNSTLAKQARDLARGQIYPNDYQTMDETQRNEQQNKTKDVEQSQDYMDAMLIDVKAKRAEKEQKNLAEKPTIDKQSRDMEASQNRMAEIMADAKQKNSLGKEETLQQELPNEPTANISISTRFSQSLNYTRTLEQSDKSIAPTKDKESPDRD